MKSTHFKHQQAKELLHNKFVVILGDSNQRGMYKDLVQMLQRDDYLSRPQLKSKGEEVFENDKLLDGGMRGKMTNGTEYREVRQYTSDHHQVRFYFTTRVYSEYVGEILEELNNDPKPDLVIVNSCVWDVSRYGRKWRDGYLQNLATFFEKLKAILPEDSLIIWNMALPLSKTIVGGFLVPEIAEFGPMLRFDIVEANYWSATVARAYGLDVLDLHFHFRRSLQLRAQDGVHWNGVAHRHITCLLLAHAAQAWGVEMPLSQLPTVSSWQQRQRWVNFHKGPAFPWMAPHFYPDNSGAGNIHFANGPYPPPHTHPGFRPPNTPRANSGNGNVHFANGPYASQYTNPGFRPQHTPIVLPENSGNGNMYFANGPSPHTNPGFRPPNTPRENSGNGNVHFGNGPSPPHTNPGFRPQNAPRVPPVNSGNGNIHFASGPSPHTNPSFRPPNIPRVPPENSVNGNIGNVHFGNGPSPPHTIPGFKPQNAPGVPPGNSGNGNMHFANGPSPHTNPGFRPPNIPRVSPENSGNGNMHFGNGPSPHTNPGFRPPNIPRVPPGNGNMHFANGPSPHTNTGFRPPNAPRVPPGNSGAGNLHFGPNRPYPPPHTHPGFRPPNTPKVEQPGNRFMRPLPSHPQMNCPGEQPGSTGYMACGNGFYPNSQTNSPREQLESNGNMPCGNRFYTNAPTNSPQVSPQQSASNGFFHGPHGPKNLPRVPPEQSGFNAFYPNGQTNSSRVPAEQSGSNGNMACGNGFYPNGPTSSPRDQCNSSSQTLFKHLFNFCAKVQDFSKNAVLPQVGQCHAQGFNNYPQRHSLCDNSAFVMRRKVPGHAHYRPY